MVNSGITDIVGREVHFMKTARGEYVPNMGNNTVYTEEYLFKIVS